jgi:DNA-directed RNA polymerase subunit M/transcription elongation factor TFIIS
LESREITVNKKYPGCKNWSQKIIKVQKAMMTMDCPGCGAKKISYTSRQLRSADEGETVFLDCEACGYKGVI